MSVSSIKRKILIIAKNDGLKAGYWVNFRPFVKLAMSLEGDDKDDYDTALAEIRSEGIFESKENGDDYLTMEGENILNKLS